MKPLFGFYFICALFIVFTCMAGAGIYLISDSVEAKIARTTSTPTSAEVKADSKGLDIKLTTAIPGLFIFSVGAAGLLLLTWRVPVKRILGYKEPPRSPPGTMNLMAFSSFSFMPQPILEDKIQRIPLLLWWLARWLGLAVRVPKD